MNILEEFQKRAKEAGLTEEQTQAFVAENLQTPPAKTAEETLADAYTQLLADAGVEKSAEAVTYLDSFLKSAIDSGVEIPLAVDLAKHAVALSFPNAATEEKQAVAADEWIKASYVQGIFEKAASYGLSEEQTLVILQKNAALSLSGVPKGAFKVGKGAPKVKLNTPHPGVPPELPGAIPNVRIPSTPVGTPHIVVPPVASATTPAATTAAVTAAAANKGIDPGTAALIAAAAGGTGVSAGMTGHQISDVVSKLSTPSAPAPGAGAAKSPKGDASLLDALKAYADKSPATAYGGGGAAIGGILGALSGEDEHVDPDDPHKIIEGSRLRNAGIGSVLGLGTGLLASAGSPQSITKSVA